MNNANKIYLATTIVLFLFFGYSSHTSFDDDLFLRKIIKTNNLKPLSTRDFHLDEKYNLGRSLFFDPILSGNRDISCATCHLWDKGSTDGIPLSIGTTGIGISTNRVKNRNRDFVPRNSQDLWNRDNNDVRALFWDGRIEMIDPEKRLIRSPLGKDLPDGLENILSAQALFPLIRHDEMLGIIGDTSPNSLPEDHRNKPNELTALSDNLTGNKKSLIIYDLLLARLFGENNSEKKSWQKEYRRLFSSAYPDLSIQDISIVEVANAISHFEELAFATRNTPWDKYLSGDDNAINTEAKNGAIIFYGKGKCSTCHSGNLFSDFNYYSIGVPQVNINTESPSIDFGRYSVTGNDDDKFKFRTPPLRNVTKSGPYFHNGYASSLIEVIEQHMDPLKNANSYKEDGSFGMNIDEINAVSPIILDGIKLSQKEMNDLISFLETLNDYVDPEKMKYIIPETVPSGIPINDLKPLFND